MDSRTKAAGKAVRVAKAASRVVRADNAKAARVATINGSVAALRFFFTVTLDRPEIARHLTFVREPRKIPVVLSPVNAVSNFLTCAEVKFPRPPISVISRQRDHELRFWEADRDGAEAVLGLAH